MFSGRIFREIFLEFQEPFGEVFQPVFMGRYLGRGEGEEGGNGGEEAGEEKNLHTGKISFATTTCVGAEALFPADQKLASPPQLNKKYQTLRDKRFLPLLFQGLFPAL